MSFIIPWQEIIGGFILGFSVVLLLITNGKVLGVSGVLANILTPTKKITENYPDYYFLINVVYNINSLISEPLLWLSN